MTEQKIEVHKKVFSIAWGDMDALGHVNHARYFDYFQEARVEWLREHNMSMTEKTGPVLIHAACTFLKPVVYPASVTVCSAIRSIGRSSMMMDHDLYQDEVLMVQGSCKIVWVDYTQNKSVGLPDVFRDLFESQQL